VRSDPSPHFPLVQFFSDINLLRSVLHIVIRRPCRSRVAADGFHDFYIFLYGNFARSAFDLSLDLFTLLSVSHPSRLAGEPLPYFISRAPPADRTHPQRHSDESAFAGVRLVDLCSDTGVGIVVHGKSPSPRRPTALTKPRSLHSQACYKICQVRTPGLDAMNATSSEPGPAPSQQLTDADIAAAQAALGEAPGYI